MDGPPALAAPMPHGTIGGMRRGLPFVLLLLALLAAYALLQRPPAPAADAPTATGAPPVQAPPARADVPEPLARDGNMRADAPRMRGTPADAQALPPEARDTLRLIAQGGPFPHRQDGGTFGNRERRLPTRAHGWYREYTVRTPGARDRGARRIVTGGDPPGEFFYTDDHYRSFRRIDARGAVR